MRNGPPCASRRSPHRLRPLPGAPAEPTREPVPEDRPDAHVVDRPDHGGVHARVVHARREARGEDAHDLRVPGGGRAGRHPQREVPRGRSDHHRRLRARGDVSRPVPGRLRHRPGEAAGRRSGAVRLRSSAPEHAPQHPHHGDPAGRPHRRGPALGDEPLAGWRRARDAVRAQPAQDGVQGPAQDHVRRRRRRGRGDRGARGGQGLPPVARQVPGDGRQDPPRRAPVRATGDGQDAARPRRGR